MKPEFDYREVPNGFAHCFRDGCPQAEDCLRHIAATHSSTGQPYLCIVNPAYLPADSLPCPFYSKSERIRVAWGVKDLYRKLTLEQADDIKNTLLAHYGKSHYYRLYRKENCIMPKDQAYIRRIFWQYGVQEEPAFEYYSEVYDWKRRPAQESSSGGNR